MPASDYATFFTQANGSAAPYHYQVRLARSPCESRHNRSRKLWVVEDFMQSHFRTLRRSAGQPRIKWIEFPSRGILFDLAIPCLGIPPLQMKQQNANVPRRQLCNRSFDLYQRAHSGNRSTVRAACQSMSGRERSWRKEPRPASAVMQPSV